MKALLFTLAALVLGPVFIWRGIAEYCEASQAKGWPSTQGIVKEVDVTQRSGRRGRTTFIPYVQYGYDVGGQPYGAHRVSFQGEGSSSMEKALAVAMRYQKDKPVTVYYDAKNPESAVLEREAGADLLLPALIGLGMLGYGIFSARSLWEEFNKNDFAPSDGGL